MSISPTTLTIPWDNVPRKGDGFTGYDGNNNPVITGVVTDVVYSGETVTITVGGRDSATFACIEGRGY